MRVGLVLLAACAPTARSADVRNSRAEPEPVFERPALKASAPRPDLDLTHLVPDFHDELRWPLTSMSHPSLEPRFNIAAVFAQAGVGWLDLCKRGAHNRTFAGRYRDELEYLRGWCSAIKGDVDIACERLAPLAGSTVAGLASAVRFDLANILADAGDADKAERWLTRHHIDDPELLDTLAATYVEVGNERDAWSINRRVMGIDDHATIEAQCHRLVRHIVLSPEGERIIPVTELEQIATKPKLPNFTCVQLHHAVQCWLDPAKGCFDYLSDQQLDTRNDSILWAYHAWPRGPAPEETWLRIAERVRTAAPLPGASELATTALETAVKSTSVCLWKSYLVIEATVAVLRRVAVVPEHLDALLEACPFVVTPPN